MKLNSPDLVWGLKSNIAIYSMAIMRIALVMVETKEAAIWTTLVTRISLDRF